MDPEQIRALQAEAKRLEAAQAATEQSRDAASAPPRETARRPEGFAAMMNLFIGMEPSSFAWLLGMGSVFLLIGGGLLVDAGHLDGEKWVLLVVFGVFGLCPWLTVLVTLVRYAGFRGWRGRLPFTLTGGWEQLAASKGDKTWHETRLEVVLADPHASARPAVEALLRIFSVHANKSHFRPRSFGGSLQAWKAKGLQASGDTGGRVGWKLHRFIASDLAKLKHSGVPINEVRIIVGRAHDVQPESDSS